MTAEEHSLILEHLRHIRASVDRIAEDMRDLKFRMGNVETNTLHLTHRMDRFDERVARVERRLGLLDTEH
jgi:hypothetical protein